MGKTLHWLVLYVCGLSISMCLFVCSRGKHLFSPLQPEEGITAEAFRLLYPQVISDIKVRGGEGGGRVDEEREWIGVCGLVHTVQMYADTYMRMYIYVHTVYVRMCGRLLHFVFYSLFLTCANLVHVAFGLCRVWKRTGSTATTL